ncbi:H-NS histone family protein [Cupriavidus sp.]|jgi:DNA-binding protein H-NS|uniref:H-NS histone family protein n=1 Tax=Cupriavidus sp. TaxID=1873897 RepID=UPI0025BAFF39|nr:H-NS histone family protein [Cupriavidus sp.]MCA3184056.1 H-NS histone family protein [Cupriavidus sp.]MCA3188746.1 H-NS histone family protein [Cupriavidus sp.]MCA3199762.1 H-NS histone family protein [Cupriavidus sp.]MCA3205236.1 H-NS histone family protein [Cupriavidus sp.]MCA3210344.1 H-NS histone family protein [Cupriavidus sp.]
MPTYKQLLAEKEALEAKLSEVRANEVASVIEQIRQLMADYDLTVEDIAPKRRRGRPAGSGAAQKAASALPPKYRDPKTGKTWSGRGRAPAWLGKRPERFLIEQA